MSLYLGRDLGPAHERERALVAVGDRVRWHQSPDPDREVIDLLARGNVVARCVGRTEFGARALGHRSVLADPSRPQLRNLINEMVKERDFWMPFAPAVLTARAEDYVVKPKAVDARFMTIAFETRPEMRDSIRAAIHPADATARIQEVDPDTAPDMYRLLTLWQQRSGSAALLNTSFNLHGHPIVDTAKDALDVFVRSGLRHLQLDEVIVSKV